MADPAAPQTLLDRLANLEREVRILRTPTPLPAWTTFATVVSQGGTVTHTPTYCRYVKLGRTVIVSMLITITGSGAGATAFTCSVPFASVQAGGLSAGIGSYYDWSTTTPYRADVVLYTTTTVAMVPTHSTQSYLGVSHMTTGLAANDTIDMTIIYESAA